MGFLQEELSDLGDLPAGFKLQSLEQALEDNGHGETVKAMLDAALEDEHNPFSALNIAFCKKWFLFAGRSKGYCRTATTHYSSSSTYAKILCLLIRYY